MHTDATERIWWRTPRTAKRRKPASGGTTSGTRHILRDPTWVIGCKQTRNKKHIGKVLKRVMWISALQSGALWQVQCCGSGFTESKSGSRLLLNPDPDSDRGFLQQRKFVFVQEPPPPLPPPWEYRSSQPAIDWRKCREFQRYNPALNGRSSVADSHSLNLCPDPGCHWIQNRIQTEVFYDKTFFFVQKP